MQTGMADFFKFNLWANQQLLSICATLDEAQLGASVNGTRGALQDTLVHLLAAEQRYVRTLTGKTAEILVSEKNPFPGFDMLRQSAQFTGEALIQVAEQFQSDDMLHGTFSGEEYQIPAIVLLLQAIVHGTDHRSQIATILTQQGISVPEFDAWNYYDEVMKPAMAQQDA